MNPRSIEFNVVAAEPPKRDPFARTRLWGRLLRQLSELDETLAVEVVLNSEDRRAVQATVLRMLKRGDIDWGITTTWVSGKPGDVARRCRIQRVAAKEAAK